MLIVFSVLAVYGIQLIFNRDVYTVCVNFNSGETVESVDVRFGEDCKNESSEILSVDRTKYFSDHVKVRFKALKKGTENTFIAVHLTTPGGSTKTQAAINELKVRSFNFITKNLYRDFYIVLSAIAALLLVYYICLFVNTLKTDRYSYNSIFFLATALFLALLLAVWVSSAAYSFINYHAAYSDIIFVANKNLLTAAVAASFPLTALFVLSVTISNIRLITKEGARPANALGIAASVVMGIGLLTIAALFYLDQNFSFAAVPVIRSVASAFYIFFEVVLLSTIFCGIYVSRFTPEFDKDYIIILGCKIRKDGSLYPLVRGRADKAIEFYKKQLAATGKEAYFVPSGGKGNDEIMPEAEAIANYLEEQGIPGERILPETRSATTKENMRFSKELIDAQSENAKLVFSTTNYHVFRSGIIAGEAGIKADGIGSKTKWYFWPNAFLRETAGLFLSKPKKQLILILAVSVAAGLGSYFYSIM